VMEKDRSVVVEDRVVVSENRRGVLEERENMVGSQAVRIPPRLPSASRVANEERREVRKDRVLELSVRASLVS
jgi:hypothetical protein